MNISEIIKGHSPSIANEALYFCIRVLKQADHATSSKKDPYHDTVSSKPSETSVQLSKKILGEIEFIEGAPIDDLPKKKIDKYITLVSKASNELSASNLKIDIQRGAELLRKIREIEDGASEANH